MATICVIGMGYVGLVTAACLADFGNEVIGLDIDTEKIAHLRQGVLPIYEPGLEEIVERTSRAGRLSFTSDYAEAIPPAEFILIAVDTPSGANGQADLSSVQRAARGIAEHLRRPAIIINKSTVPIGAGDMVAQIIAEHRRCPVEFAVVSNPEFLREGSAVYDFLNPDRIVLGATDRQAAERVAQLYAPLKCPIMITDLRTAEMIKYASNSFLATKISFINEIAQICEKLGADVREVARGMGLDRRIGPAFLEAGLGWGGSCFPKDVRALEYMATVQGCHPQLLRAVMEINRDQRIRVVQKVRDLLGGLQGRVIGILGLAFKPNTDDIREAPSLDVINLLQSEGAIIKAYDPVAMGNAAKVLRDVQFCSDPYEVARGADALVIVTEWNEFKQLALERLRDLMRRPVIVDGRNIYEPAQMRALGFLYQCIGRPC